MSNKAASGSVERKKSLGPRNILIIVAAFELFAVLLDFLFGRMSILFREPLEPAGPGIGDLFTKIYFACRPLLTVAALALVASGRARHAIVALGSIEMARWMNYTAWVVHNGLPFDDGLAIQWTVAQIFVFPVIAACGVALAVRDKRLGLAIALIGVPILYNLAGFAIYIVLLVINGP